MAITVAMDDLLADWRRAWVTESETVKLRFTPQGIPPVQDPLGARSSIEEALDRAYARSESGFPDDFPPSMEILGIIEDGFGLSAQAESEAGVALLMALVVEELEAQGWSGRLTPLPFVELRQPRRHLGSYPTATLALGLRVDNRIRTSLRRTPPDASRELRRRLSSLGASLLDSAPGSTVLGVDTINTIVSPQAAPELLSLAMTHAVTSSLQRSDTKRMAALSVDRHSIAVVQLRHGDNLAADHVNRLRALGAAWAPFCEFVLLTATGGPCETMRSALLDSGRGKRRGLAGRSKDSPLDAHRLPDAFAWQIVDAEQAARVGDTTGWVIREITDDRWLISTPELAEGTLGEAALAQLASPTPDDVENARTSLADLLVHTSIYV